MKTFRRAHILQLLFALAVIASCKSRQPVVKNTRPVPPAPPVTTQVPADTIPEPVVFKSKYYKIALVMPFDLKQNFDKDTAGLASELGVTNFSLPAIHFYEGAMLAADSLEKDSIFVTYKSFDAPNDENGLKSLFGGPFLKNFDVVLASVNPVYAEAVATAAHGNRLKLVLTQASTIHPIQGHPEVALAAASTFTQCRESARMLTGMYPSARVHFISRTVKRENELAAVFREAISSQVDSAKIFNFDATTRPVEEMLKQLSTTERNLIFVVSSDEAFVKNTLLGLNAMEMSGLYVCGLPTWIDFETIDFMNMENMKFFLFDNDIPETESPNVNAFRKLFIQKYSADPLPQGYNGFDLVYALCSSDSGTICSKLTSLNSRNLYHFTAPEPGDGCENHHVSLYTIEDYKLRLLRSTSRK